MTPFVYPLLEGSLPYFIFHQSAYSSASKNIHKGNFKDVCFDIPESVMYIYLTASKWIKKYFINYKEMDSHTALLQLNNIVYDGVGLLDYEQSDILRKLTVFNALFSTNYL